MSESQGTNLRRSYERARDLDFEAQLGECVDLLQHPELLAAELAEAFASLRSAVDTSACGDAPTSAPPSTSRPASPSEPYFYASRDVFVVGAPDSFTCLSHHVRPLLSPPGLPADEGIDYTAITCTADRRPLLGIVQSDRDASPYPLLLRGLACLTEIATERALADLDRQGFRGLLGATPLFDLHLMLWDHWSGEQAVPERTPLGQLSRDLAEVTQHALRTDSSSPPILRDIVCLQMNPARFDGRVRFAWRV